MKMNGKCFKCAIPGGVMWRFKFNAGWILFRLSIFYSSQANNSGGDSNNNYNENVYEIMY